MNIKDPRLPILLEERRRKGKAKGELTFIRKNGEKFLGFISSHIFKDENGHERTSMTIFDLTEIKKREKALKESEEQYRYLFDTIAQGIVYQDSTGNITSANIAAQKILGLTLDEMQGRTSTDPRWKSIHEDGSDFPGENHPAMLALKTGQKIENVVMGVYDPKREEQRWIKINAIPQFKNNEKLPYQVYTTFEDITKRKKALESLKESEERYSITLDAVNDGLWDWNVSSGDAFFSPNYYKLLDYNPGEFPASYESWRLLVHPEDIDSVEKELEESVKFGIGFEIDLRMKTKSQNWLWVSTRGKSIEKDSTGMSTRMVGTLSDISRRKNVELSLKESEEKYRIISENTGDVIWVLDINSHKFSYVSPSVYKLRGYTVEEVLKQSLEEVMTPESYQFISDNLPSLIQSIIAGDDSALIKTKRIDQLHKNGTVVPTEVVTTPLINQEGQITQILGVSRDITERVKMEDQIQKSLKEKEILLKEIHHRVKNNLMVISSLLNLQSRYIKDKEVLGIFKESQSRARSMALIHERLYQSSDLKRINFGAYIRTLAIDIFHSYISDNERFKLTMDVDDLMLDINTTVPLGLILNELVSNCMKHAFPDDRTGEIKIDFHKNDGEYVLKVSDNGIGFPEDLDFKNTQSLGLQIVNSLTNQIDGEVYLDQSQGTAFTITFQESKYS